MKISNIRYTQVNDFLVHEKLDDLLRFQKLAAEYGLTREGERLWQAVLQTMDEKLDAYEALVASAEDANEPDGLSAIRALRPSGPRRMADRLPPDYPQRLRGAFYGRMAGCTLGAALEFRSVDEMREWAEHFGDAYPPTDYWSEIHNPMGPHYIVGRKADLTRGRMDAVPPDDDTVYTLLGLLTMEEYGLNFTQENMAEVWKRYLPLGDETPPGQPEKAAALAWRDASANHRRNGVYGSMFMAATIAAAFVTDDPLEAVRIGLTEIPRACLFAEGVRWALEQDCADYREAADAVWARYDGMFNGSALTNALHVVMGLQIGQKDFTRTIGETIAMSGDNDCTGATAGSILGAVIGYGAIPAQWVEPFNGRMHIYLNGLPEYQQIDAVCDRLHALARTFVRG